MIQYHKQQGFSFIELMIGFTLLAIGFTGAFMMQGIAKKSNLDALQRALATELAVDIISRMKANLPTTLIDSYTEYNGLEYATSTLLSPPTKRCQSFSAPCISFSEIVANDLYEWEQAILGNTKHSGQFVSGLINPTGCIHYEQGNLTIVLSWQGRQKTTDAASHLTSDSIANTCGTASSSRRQVVLETFIF